MYMYTYIMIIKTYIYIYIYMYIYENEGANFPPPASRFDALRRRDWCFIAEQSAPAPHLAHSGGCAASRLVLITVPCASRSREHFPNWFDLHLLLPTS